MRHDDLPDYYAVLGIPMTADAVAIRAAYHRLALRFHPDQAGAASTRAFQRLAEAYAVLCDPERRARYDALVSRNRGPSEAPRQAPPEPTPARPSASRPARALLWRLSGPLPSIIGSGAARRADDGSIELLLEPNEAIDGGYATVSVHAPDLVNHWVTIPAGAVDGTVIVSTVRVGGTRSEIRFRLRVRI